MPYRHRRSSFAPRSALRPALHQTTRRMPGNAICYAYETPLMSAEPYQLTCASSSSASEANYGAWNCSLPKRWTLSNTVLPRRPVVRRLPVSAGGRSIAVRKRLTWSTVAAHSICDKYLFLDSGSIDSDRSRPCQRRLDGWDGGTAALSFSNTCPLTAIR